MILAAGRGMRMGELTLNKPKPLLEVNGQTLLENKIMLLKAAGVTEIVVNLAYLGEQIREFAGDGSRWQVNIQYSVEPEPLETAGGIAHALPLLGDDVFLAINADIWCDYPLGNLVQTKLQAGVLGHLVMVANPSQHANGDFSLDEHQMIEQASNSGAFTYSGIALYNPDIIRTYPKCRECFPLLEVFQYRIARKELSGEFYPGFWNDVGTPERLRQVSQHNPSR